MKFLRILTRCGLIRRDPTELLASDYTAERVHADQGAPAQLERFEPAVGDHGINRGPAEAQGLGSIVYGKRKWFHLQSPCLLAGASECRGTLANRLLNRGQ